MLGYGNGLNAAVDPFIRASASHGPWTEWPWNVYAQCPATRNLASCFQSDLRLKFSTHLVLCNNFSKSTTQQNFELQLRSGASVISWPPKWFANPWTPGPESGKIALIFASFLTLEWNKRPKFNEPAACIVLITHIVPANRSEWKKRRKHQVSKTSTGFLFSWGGGVVLISAGFSWEGGVVLISAGEGKPILSSVSWEYSLY